MAEKEITIHTATNEGQDLQVYVISYRGLLPVMNTITKAARNQNIEYNICFQNAAGETIMDADFYRILTWGLFLYRF